MNPTSRDVHIPSAIGNDRKRQTVSKPWSVSNIPPSLKNFSDPEKAKFADSLSQKDATKNGSQVKDGFFVTKGVFEE